MIEYAIARRILNSKNYVKVVLQPLWTMESMSEGWPLKKNQIMPIAESCFKTR